MKYGILNRTNCPKNKCTIGKERKIICFWQYWVSKCEKRIAAFDIILKFKLYRKIISPSKTLHNIYIKGRTNITSKPMFQNYKLRLHPSFVTQHPLLSANIYFENKERLPKRVFYKPKHGYLHYNVAQK